MSYVVRATRLHAVNCGVSQPEYICAGNLSVQGLLQGNAVSTRCTGEVCWMLQQCLAAMKSQLSILCSRSSLMVVQAVYENDEPVCRLCVLEHTEMTQAMHHSGVPRPKDSAQTSQCPDNVLLQAPPSPPATATGKLWFPTHQTDHASTLEPRASLIHVEF